MKRKTPDENDYIMTDDEDSVWIEIGPVILYIRRGPIAGQVIVEAFRNETGEDALNDPLATMAATP